VLVLSAPDTPVGLTVITSMLMEKPSWRFLHSSLKTNRGPNMKYSIRACWEVLIAVMGPASAMEYLAKWRF